MPLLISTSRGAGSPQILCSIAKPQISITGESGENAAAAPSSARGWSPIHYSLMAPRKTTRHAAAISASCLPPKSRKIHKAKRGSLKATKARPLPVKKRQSPIDIRREVCSFNPKKCQPSTFRIAYVPGDCSELATSSSGFKVTVAEKCSTTLQAKHLPPGTYQLAQFHAHWGTDCSNGSEHLVEGQGFSAEVHIVFWNRKYGTFERAASRADGLAVVAVFLKEGDHSASYSTLLEAVSTSVGSNEPVQLATSFSLEQLLPEADRRDFCTYAGSLTTPPYSESVIWTVFLEPVGVSRSQLDILRRVTVAPIVRECQELHGRKVLSSRKM